MSGASRSQRRESVAAAGGIRRSVVEYSVAGLAVVLAVFVRWLLNPLLDHRLPFITFFGAVAVAVWFGGWRPAVLAALLGYIATERMLFQTEPGTPLAIGATGGLAALAAYVFTCLVIIALGSGMRNAQRRAEAHAQEAVARQRQLEQEVEQRQAAEESLRQNEERLLQAMQQLQIVTDCMAAPVARCSRDFKYLWVSRPYADWFGLPPHEIVGRPIVEVLGQEAFQRLRPYFERVLSGETVRYEEMVNFKGLRERWVSAVYAPTHDTAGTPDGWVAVVIDIHHRKQAEEALEAADRRKDEFLATLAHELGNAFVPLRFGLELLERAGDDRSCFETARSLMQRQLRVTVQLIDDLRDISGIKWGKMQLRKQRVALAAVVNSAVERARPFIQESAHELTVALPVDAIYLDADPTRLAQALSNLLNNAAKYTDRGGHIWVTAHQQDGEGVVSIRDTGMGIAPEHLADIFDMFSQAAPAHERSRGGLGIGLSLVKQLVGLHDGRVEARSDGPGKGSEFIVRLPVAERAGA
jgi:PAS domain S-box-containing protein